MTSTREMLTQTVDNVYDTLSEYADQIDTGDYRSRTAVKDLSDMFGEPYVIAPHYWLTQFDWYTLDSVDYSGQERWNDLLTDIESALEDNGYLAEYGVIYATEDHDEPTIDDTPISEYGLELITEIGRPWTWVLGTGGPHIEITADGSGRAKLVGYWGGERVERSGYYIDRVLDYMLEAAGYRR